MSEQNPREFWIKLCGFSESIFPYILKGNATEEEIHRAFRVDAFPMLKVIDIHKYDQLLTEALKLKEALKFYAEKDNYLKEYIANKLDPLKRTTTKIEFDSYGYSAREALAQWSNLEVNYERKK